MSYMDYSKMFSCPRCGAEGAIYLLKVAKDKIIIKQRCPKHGGRAFKLPLMQKDQFISHIRDGVFRCFKCGQDATVDHIKGSGPWTLIRLACPTHRNKLPFQKIWNTVYSEISSMVATSPQAAQSQAVEPQPEQPQPTPSEEKKFCPNCGTPLEGAEVFCGACGAEID